MIITVTPKDDGTYEVLGEDFERIIYDHDQVDPDERTAFEATSVSADGDLIVIT